VVDHSLSGAIAFGVHGPNLSSKNVFPYFIGSQFSMHVESVCAHGRKRDAVNDGCFPGLGMQLFTGIVSNLYIVIVLFVLVL
jgi:hypothetical protein